MKSLKSLLLVAMCFFISAAQAQYHPDEIPYPLPPITATFNAVYPTFLNGDGLVQSPLQFLLPLTHDTLNYNVKIEYALRQTTSSQLYATTCATIEGTIECFVSYYSYSMGQVTLIKFVKSPKVNVMPALFGMFTHYECCDFLDGSMCICGLRFARYYIQMNGSMSHAGELFVYANRPPYCDAIKRLYEFRFTIKFKDATGTLSHYVSSMLVSAPFGFGIWDN